MISAVTTAIAYSFSWLAETKNEYFFASLPTRFTTGPCFEFEVLISRNEILSGIDFITDSLIANFAAKCSYGDLNFVQYFISDSNRIFQ